jgi:hypothetical protein
VGQTSILENDLKMLAAAGIRRAPARVHCLKGMRMHARQQILETKCQSLELA